MSQINADFANQIKRRCRHWFDTNKNTLHQKHTDILWENFITELTLVEAHLILQSLPATPPTDAVLKWQSQNREDRIERIEANLKHFPQLEQQIRSSLDSLWEIYRREGIQLPAPGAQHTPC